ncbi:hypothetical protein GW7_15270 [Heterocephalus glaber]|uniref:Uncharacterized protein n=1 Tax=Heterocephalus glaber TaxID=10181 RepID=G5BZ15_HETGA|nr:hypothetical protein GW7_15270 [Heterocephalus glaber]
MQLPFGAVTSIFRCRSSFQCLLPLLMTPQGCPSQGHARPQDGALGLFTLRHTITERWIRSYLRSAFSQRSLATEPPRYKYTRETCVASYFQPRPVSGNEKHSVRDIPDKSYPVSPTHFPKGDADPLNLDGKVDENFGLEHCREEPQRRQPSS